ncbi:MULTISPECIES: flagellar hook assembly protein FlgD [unclassified Roseitalea]|uniref:flagellar hook assembly protein FlgD n=1 Tax=unclassified Roseitalea TaxID=2639107 RepID=UPI002740186E|nr:MULTISPECIES: flagellar hook assembly protein FlgD [unclassified Roseitalea]
MSDVSAIAGVSAAGASAPASRTTVDYEAFLQLLVTQMKNQDPTEPMSNTEYVAQLASFSNVEQNTKVNDKLDYLISMMGIQQAGAMIGRAVTSPDGAVSGVVSEVRIFDDGIVAVLEDGQQLPVGPGVTVR